MITSELTPKRLEMLKEAVPAISRVLRVRRYLIDPIAPLQVKALEAAAPALGIKLIIREKSRAATICRPHLRAQLQKSPRGLS